MDTHDENLYAEVSELLGPLLKEMQYWEHAPELENRAGSDSRALLGSSNEFVSSEVYPYPGIRSEQSVREYKSRGRKVDGKHESSIAGGHAHALSKAAEYSNTILKRNSSPFRFSIFERKRKLYIKIMKLGRKGKKDSERVREITHNDFIRLINDVLQIEGLWVDDTV